MDDYDYDGDEAYDEDKRYNSVAANTDKRGMTKTDAYKGPTVCNSEHAGTPQGTRSR